MSQPRDHSGTARKITFSWEKKPGVSKVSSTPHGENQVPKQQEFLEKLPPPPCTPEEANHKNPLLDYQIPLPPCAFQPPYYRTSSKRGLWVQSKDPFLAAFKECTKNQKGAKVNKKLIKDGIESRVRKSISFFSISCTRSCTVHDTNLVTISHLDKD